MCVRLTDSVFYTFHFGIEYFFGSLNDTVTNSRIQRNFNGHKGTVENARIKKVEQKAKKVSSFNSSHWRTTSESLRLLTITFLFLFLFLFSQPLWKRRSVGRGKFLLDIKDLTSVLTIWSIIAASTLTKTTRLVPSSMTNALENWRVWIPALSCAGLAYPI